MTFPRNCDGCVSHVMGGFLWYMYRLYTIFPTDRTKITLHLELLTQNRKAHGGGGIEKGIESRTVKWCGGPAKYYKATIRTDFDVTTVDSINDVLSGRHLVTISTLGSPSYESSSCLPPVAGSVSTPAATESPDQAFAAPLTPDRSFVVPTPTSASNPTATVTTPSALLLGSAKLNAEKTLS